MGEIVGSVWWTWALGLALLAAGCDGSRDGLGNRCDSAEGCAEGLVCLDGTCQEPGAGDGDADTDGDGDVDSDGDGDNDVCGLPCGLACCEAGERCLDELCIPDNGTCEEGEACLDDTSCVDGVCVPFDPDGFDPSCAREPPRADRFLTVPQCAFTEAPPGDPLPAYMDAHATPVVVDLDLDEDPGTIRPSIVYAGTVASFPWEQAAVVRIVDGETCAQQQALAAYDQLTYAGPVAAGDLDDDGRPEIVALAYGGGLIAFGFDATTHAMGVLWRSPDRRFLGSWNGPSIADLDDDGSPEILVGGVVYGADGTLLTSALGPVAIHGSSGFYFAYSFGVTADVDLDGAPELVVHNGTYGWDATSPGWVLEEYFEGSFGAAGWVAIADLGDFPDAAGDAVGRPEVVVSGNGQVRVQSIGGTVLAGPVARGMYSGPPTIADFDGDGAAELGAADAAGYRVLRPDGELLWEVASQDNSSGQTGSSVFDFEGDGRAEAIYADECYVRVYDGPTGDVLYSVGRTSCTWSENPVVADVDGDYHSEIVVPLDTACRPVCAAVDPVFAGLRCAEDGHCPEGAVCGDGLCQCASDADCGDRHGCRDGVCKAIVLPRRAGIEVLRDVFDRWAPSRPIWNQHAYHITNVTDSGSVPRSSAVRRNWEVPGLNNFRQNVLSEYPESALWIPDLTVGGLEAPECNTEEQSQPLSASVCNRGTLPVAPGVDVSFRLGSPDGEVVCSFTTEQVLEPGECEQLECLWEGLTLGVDYEVFAVVDGDEEVQVSECHEDNNMAAEEVRCPPIMY